MYRANHLLSTAKLMVAYTNCSLRLLSPKKCPWITQCYLSDKKGGIKSHPTPTAKSNTEQYTETVKLKDCKPVDINPLRPSPYTKPVGTPPVDPCVPPSSDTGGRGPKDSDNGRTRKRIIAGAILGAVAIGAACYMLIQPEETGSPRKTEKAKRKVKRIVKIPATSQDIPKDVPYLLIGGGTASFTAFRAIKSSDPLAKVLIVSNECYNPYMRPPLSKEIWFNENSSVAKSLIFKQWNGSERSIFYEPDDFYIDCKTLMDSKNGGVAIARGWSITHLDVMEKLAYLDDGVPIKYNKCLIATGATPRLTPVFEIAMSNEQLRDKIKIFRNIDDFKDVFESFETSRSVVVVGGGFLGSELACAFGRIAKTKSTEVFQIFREKGNMGHLLPEYLSLWTTQKVTQEGVQVIPSTEIVDVKYHNGKVDLKLSSGKNLLADFVVVAAGVEPNTELAEKSDLEVDPELGGYLVNTELQARTDLYIAGDCACFYDPRLGRRRIEHHDHAVVSGRLAGENMAGGRNPYFHQSMFWSDLGPEVGYEAIGIVDSSLPTVGVFAKQTLKDTPKAVVTETGESDRSKTEEIPEECDKYATTKDEKAKLHQAPQNGDYGKGVVFYLRDDVVVGIVLWNVFNRMSIARQVLKDQRKYDDLNEVAKLFNIHGEE